MRLLSNLVLVYCLVFPLISHAETPQETDFKTCEKAAKGDETKINECYRVWIKIETKLLEEKYNEVQDKSPPAVLEQAAASLIKAKEGGKKFRGELCSIPTMISTQLECFVSTTIAQREQLDEYMEILAAPPEEDEAPTTINNNTSNTETIPAPVEVSKPTIPTNAPNSSNDVLSVSARDLHNQFNSNEIAALKMINNREVAIMGKVLKVENQGSTGIRISLITNDTSVVELEGLHAMRLEINKSSEDAASRLSKHDNAVITCKKLALRSVYVVGSECHI